MVPVATLAPSLKVKLKLGAAPVRSPLTEKGPDTEVPVVSSFNVPVPVKVYVCVVWLVMTLEESMVSASKS